MLNFRILQAMLLGFANEPVVHNTDPRLILITENRIQDGFHLQFNGKTPENYHVWISPVKFHSNTAYMDLRIIKTNGHIDQLIFRVCATNAGMTYEYTFNFIEGMPNVEMRQGRGTNVTGERVTFKTMRCIDLVVLDFIEGKLPPQILAYRPEPGPYYPASTADKPCFVCNTVILPYNWEICDACRTNNASVAAAVH